MVIVVVLVLVVYLVVISAPAASFAVKLLIR